MFCRQSRRLVTPKCVYTLDQMKSVSRHSVGTFQGNKLTGNSSGNVTEPLWPIHPGWKWNWCLPADLHFHFLVLKHRQGVICQPSPQIPSMQGKSRHHQHHSVCLNIPEWTLSHFTRESQQPQTSATLAKPVICVLLAYSNYCHVTLW